MRSTSRPSASISSSCGDLSGGGRGERQASKLLGESSHRGTRMNDIGSEVGV